MNIKQLRQTILDRAIRGQLVSQDPTDEPASILLERIRAEKEELIKEKKLKREKRDSQPIKEVPFEIPEGWVWCRLGDISLINPKNNLNDELDVSFIPMPFISDGFSNIHTFEVEKWKNIKKGYTHFQNGDIGVAKITPCFENRKSVIFNNLENGVGAGTTELYILRNNKTISFNKYLFWVVKTQEFINKGIESFTGAVGQQRVSKDFIENTLIPLPPLKEQHRIVRKIEQLFALVDIIEVNKKALEKLIEQAKSQVLSDAVAGKLTHQDPNDEPAEELLKRIGKTTASDTPYEKMLPKGWAWCRLGDIGIINPKNNLNDELEVSFIPMALISEGFSNAYTYEVKKWKNIKKGYTHFCNEDIGIAKITPCFENRKSVIFNNLKNGVGAGTTELYILRSNKTLSFNKYIFYFVKTQEFINNGIKGFTGAVGQQRISRYFIENTLIPLPPLKEQPRIVQKIESYFTFLDVIRNNL